MSGTFNVSRDLWEDEAFPDEPFSRREAWIWLLAEAAWKARTKNVKGYVVDLERGQLAASTRFMAAAWIWSEPKVRRFLNMLENRRMIICDADAGLTRITLCKYDVYQHGARVADAPKKPRPTQDRRTTDANEKKGRKKEEKKDTAATTREAAAAPDETKDEVLVEVPEGRVNVVDFPGGSKAPQDPAQVTSPEDETWRERMLRAMGLSRSGQNGVGGAYRGNPQDMKIAERWRAAGLNDDEIVAVIDDVMRKRPGKPPATFKFFDDAMAEMVAAKALGPLAPAQPKASFPSPNAAPLPKRQRGLSPAMAAALESLTK